MIPGFDLCAVPDLYPVHGGLQGFCCSLGSVGLWDLVEAWLICRSSVDQSTIYKARLVPLQTNGWIFRKLDLNTLQATKIQAPILGRLRTRSKLSTFATAEVTRKAFLKSNIMKREDNIMHNMFGRKPIRTNQIFFRNLTCRCRHDGNDPRIALYILYFPSSSEQIGRHHVQHVRTKNIWKKIRNSSKSQFSMPTRWKWSPNLPLHFIFFHRTVLTKLVGIIFRSHGKMLGHW